MTSSNPPNRPIDLVIRVKMPWAGGRDFLEYSISSPFLPETGRPLTIAGPALQVSLGEFQAQFFERLEELQNRRDVEGGMLSSREAYEELRNICHDLYRELFPAELYAAMKTSAVETLLIVSEEPWIPWELLLPEGDDFFCLQFQMSRWLVAPGNETPSNLVQTKQVEKLIAASGVGELEHMSRELDSLLGLGLRSNSLEVQTLPGISAKQFTNLLRAKSFDLLHFAGHGEAEGESKLLLADRPLRPRLLPFDAEARIRENAPLVFFNACQVGRLEASLTRADGFAARWIERFGCSAFLAPIWSVKDGRAFEFAEAFYSNLESGLPLAESVRSAREHLRQSDPHEMTWLAYSLFGHPNAEILLGDQQPKRVATFDEPSEESKAAWRHLFEDHSEEPFFAGVPAPNPYFTGRKDLLTQLHERLQQTNSAALAQAAFHGLGGIGKTQTAIEYAHRFGEFYRYVFWVTAESETEIGTAFQNIARELFDPESGAELAVAVQKVKRWLSREQNWLLIFDNADDPSLLPNYLPSTRPGGKVLLTSRANSFEAVDITEAFRVETMSAEEAVELLLKRSRQASPDGAEELAEALGYLPLALEQAAAYIAYHGIGFRAYLKSYERRGLPMLEKGKPTRSYPSTVGKTWGVSIEEVDKISPASVELLNAAAFLAPDLIPIEIFALGAAEFGGLLGEALKGADEDPLIFWELLEPLERYSLVERLEDDEAFKLHRLVQEAVRDDLVGRQKDCASRAVRALCVAYPDVQFEKWAQCERLHPHVNPASKLIQEFNLDDLRAATLMLKAGNLSLVRGENEFASKFYRLCLDIRKHHFGSEHRDTLEAMNNLGEALRTLGRLQESRELQEKTLAIKKARLGMDDSDTLASMVNLALTIHNQGALEESRELQEEALKRQEQILDPEHPDLLMSKNNLAGILDHLGEIDLAKQLHESVLKIRERVLGLEHPDTLTSKNNLAEILRQIGKLEKARALHEENLEAMKRALGHDHPNTLAVMSNLALTLSRLGEFAEARELQEYELRISERVSGPEHPSTLTSLNNVAITSWKMGDVEVAIERLEQAYSIGKRVLSPEHPYTTRPAKALLMIAKEEEDAEMIAYWLEELRWLVDREEDSIASAEQRRARQYALDVIAELDAPQELV